MGGLDVAGQHCREPVNSHPLGGGAGSSSMKHCPNSECDHLRRFGAISEYLDTVGACSDCGAQLVDGPAPLASWTEFEDLITIYSTDSGIKAHILKGILEAESISARVVGEPLAGAVGELPIPSTDIRVQVPPELAVQARQLALAWDHGELESESEP